MNASGVCSKPYGQKSRQPRERCARSRMSRMPQYGEDVTTHWFRARLDLGNRLRASDLQLNVAMVRVDRARRDLVSG